MTATREGRGDERLATIAARRVTVEARPELEAALVHALARASASLLGGGLGAEPAAYASPWRRAGLLEATSRATDELRASASEDPWRDARVVEP